MANTGENQNIDALEAAAENGNPQYPGSGRNAAEGMNDYDPNNPFTNTDTNEFLDVDNYNEGTPEDINGNPQIHGSGRKKLMAQNDYSNTTPYKAPNISNNVTNIFNT